MSLALPAAIRLLLPDGAVKNILLEDYLRGVVAAALDADAPLEAQKALAVAARTFAAHTHRHLEQGADLCTLRHCQAWHARANPRAARATMETRGIVGTYQDQFIEAFYFEHCDGKTRGAQGILVNAPAYLKSVACPCGFAALKGHGLGMCLRGMVAMARANATYDFILRHYYSGIALEQIGIDESARVTIPVTPIQRATTPEPKPTPRPRPAPRATKSVAPPPTSAAPVEKTESPKPAPKPTPRRSARPKIEHAQADELAPQSNKSAAPQTPESAAPPLFIASDVEPKPENAEADDFVSFLAVQDAAPAPEERQTPPVERPDAPKKTISLDDALALSLKHDAPVPPPKQPSGFDLPPLVSDAPPPSMPEEFMPASSAPPPASMPEEMPNALELEFIAPPLSAPEEIISDFLAPPMAHVIEPDLDTFLPPVEKFYTPLDAPPSMPENLPSFEKAFDAETPFAWVPPPPLYENATETPQPKILLDSLPGPRVIAGNLPKPGMLITLRDATGNGIITVSGVAKHYGAGGFEAPLTDDGAYHVKFDGVELDVQVANETVFIYYQ